MLVFACISPHPPILLPNVGSSQDRKIVKKTIDALDVLSKQIAQTEPEMIIISSPHTDWGFEVPWFFLRRNLDFKKFYFSEIQSPKNPKFDNKPFAIYPILTNLDSAKQHYEWGRQIAKDLPVGRQAWIASGDLSHVLKEDGPYGFDPAGPEFDQKFIKLLKTKNISGILHLDSKFIQRAGECGLRSFCSLLGVLDGLAASWNPEILSYEGPFGVGYLVGRLI